MGVRTCWHHPCNQPLLAAPAALAQVQQEQPVSALKGHNSNAPVDVSADRIEVQDRADRAIFAGNVHVDAGRADARHAAADRRLFDGGTGGNGNVQIQRLDAAGGVVVQKPVRDRQGRLRHLRPRPQADHADRQRPAQRRTPTRSTARGW